MSTLNFAIIGTGGITLQNHLPGLALCKDVRVSALCDTSEATLEKARAQIGEVAVSTSYEDIVKRDDVHAVIIATPNIAHKPIALAAIAHGKHVLCEKPIAMSAPDAREMAAAADLAGVRHMTAFTYRFVPAMRYLRHLIDIGELGQPYHFRSCRLQDWGTRNLGWRQVKSLAGTGELGDMLSHRINFAQHLIGPIKRMVANVKNLTPMRDGMPNDTEDWVAILADFVNGATGVLESSKLASGRSESWRSLDYVEVNGSEGTFEFTTGKWNELLFGKSVAPASRRSPCRVSFGLGPARRATPAWAIRSSRSATIRLSSLWTPSAPDAPACRASTKAQPPKPSWTPPLNRRRRVSGSTLRRKQPLPFFLLKARRAASLREQKWPLYEVAVLREEGQCFGLGEFWQAVFHV